MAKSSKLKVSWKQALAGVITIILASIIILPFIPVQYEHIINTGTDTFKNHHALYGSRSITQSVELKNQTTKINLLAVDLRRKNDLKPIKVKIFDDQKQLIEETTINPSDIQDDTFAPAALTKPISPQSITIEASAPEASNQNPIGIRFHEESGHLALSLTEIMPIWQRYSIWQNDHPDAERIARNMITVGIISASGLLILFSKKFARSKWSLLIALAILGFATFSIRIPSALRIESVFGGDAFNFILKGKAWINGADPFSTDVRKGPLLPLLLFPTQLGLDAVEFGRFINITAAALSSILVALILIQLKIPKPVAIGAGLLLSTNRNFWWESLHGLSNVPYTALILATTYAFVRSRKSLWQYLTSVSSGLTTLMRYEGLLVGIILIPAMWIHHKFRPLTIKKTILPASLIILMLFIMYPFTGEIGFRPPSDLAADGGLDIAYNKNELLDNVTRLRLFVGRTWVLLPLVGDQGTYILTGIILGAIVAQLKKRKWPKITDQILTAIPYILTVYFIFLVAYDNNELQKTLILTLTLITGLGIGYLIMRKPKYTIPITVMVLAQVAISTSILPKERYFTQLVPFLAIGLACGIFAIGTWKKPVAKFGIILAISSLAGLSYGNAADHIPQFISAYNKKSHENTVVLAATRYIKKNKASLAIGYGGDIIVNSYLDNQYAFSHPTEKASLDEQIIWLKDKRPDYIMELSNRPFFTVTKDRPDLFETIKIFRTTSGSATATLYKMN